VRRQSGELLLIAHCQLRNDRRTFKLDRIVQLTKVERGAPVMVQVGVEQVACDAPVVDEDSTKLVSDIDAMEAATESNG
jgi:predicted DNA-binding transcriptional regulator YafY